MKISAYMKILAFSLALVGELSLEAVNVQLPGKQLLRKRVEQVMGKDFANRTSLVEELAEQQKEAIDVYMDVQLNLAQFKINSGENLHAIAVAQMAMGALLKAILRDSPEAVQELRDEGLVE